MYRTGTFAAHADAFGMKQTAMTIACQHTLHTVLVTVSRLMAPVSPFMSDAIHRNLEGESVHMADWPEAGGVDSEIIETMALVRELAETGRRIRVDADGDRDFLVLKAGLLAVPICQHSMKSLQKN